MNLDALFSFAEREVALRDLGLPLELDGLAAGNGPWEVELGFGKGRYLLERAARAPERRFLGVEIASKYYRLAARRIGRRGLPNVAVVRGEALYLLSTVFPAGFAAAVHVYFPDPWPKSRHHKRRLFDPETIDLVLGLLSAQGELLFATDSLDYGELVAEILTGCPGLRLERQAGTWPDGARTNYEAKYMAEGREILRLRGHREDAADVLHPSGRRGILTGPRP